MGWGEGRENYTLKLPFAVIFQDGVWLQVLGEKKADASCTRCL